LAEKLLVLLLGTLARFDQGAQKGLRRFPTQVVLMKLLPQRL
jgi:hypothetical protein